MVTNQQLRFELAKKLGRHDVPDNLWAEMQEQGYVDDALDDDYPDGFDALVTRIKVLIRLTQEASGRESPPGRKPKSATRFALPDVVWRRSDATAETIARSVATFPRLRQIRDAVSSGISVSTPQADAMLRSPAIGILSFDGFHKRGIPLLDHHASIKKDDKTSVFLRVKWKGETLEEKFFTSHDRIKKVIVFGSNFFIDDVIMRPFSVLEEIYECCHWLIDRYRWGPREAMAFILTDATPPIPLIRAEAEVVAVPDYRRGQITLNIDPTTPAEVVTHAYRELQLAMLGKDNRPLSEKSLSLAQFVAPKIDATGRRIDAAGRLITWSKLMDEWNHSCREEWKYDNAWRFQRDVMRVRDALINPNYQLPPAYILDGGIRVARSAESQQ